MKPYNQIIEYLKKIGCIFLGVFLSNALTLFIAYQWYLAQLRSLSNAMGM